MSLACLPCIAQTLPDHYPAWWLERHVISADDDDIHTNNAQNYQTALIGQLKWMATTARDEMNYRLAHVGGAGTAIDDLVNAFAGGSDGNYHPALIGQLKHVSSYYYDRLQAVGFTQWPANMSATFNTNGYPWGETIDYSESYLTANLGQLKYLFSWELKGWADTIDSDGDGLPDYWEAFFFNSNPMIADPNGYADTDLDGISDYNEFLLQTDPVVPYAALAIGADDDGDNVLNENDAMPYDAAVGELTISITSPAADAQL